MQFSLAIRMAFLCTFVWTRHEASGQCGFNANVTEEPLLISSPGWPAPYHNNRHCVWNFRTSISGYRVLLQFIVFVTEQRWDTVTGYENNVEVFRYSGSAIPPAYLTTTSYLKLQFTSDYSLRDRGFQAYVREVPVGSFSTPLPSLPTTTKAGCGFVATASRTQNGTFFSPGYPQRYPYNAKCSWHLIAPKGLLIAIGFFKFRTEHGFDFLRVYENNRRVKAFSGHSIPPLFISSKRFVDLEFTSDSTEDDEGFSGYFYAVASPPPRPALTKVEVVRIINALDAISTNELYISSSYPNWYSYQYDGEKSIEDGGHDMFDNGNKIRLRNASNEFIRVTYNHRYSFEYLTFQTRKADPFVGIAWIDDNPSDNELLIEVTGNPGSDGKGQIHIINNGLILVGSFTIRYWSFQISDAGDANIGEIYFTISSAEEWNSIYITEPDVSFASTLTLLRTEITVRTGSTRLQNVMFGYTLLSRFPTSLIEQNEIEVVLRRMFSVIKNASVEEVSITTPVTATSRTTTVPPREITTTVPPREPTVAVPPRETTAAVSPRETTTTVPPRETTTTIPQKKTIAVPPRETTTTVPPREPTAGVPPRETTAAVPPRETTTTVPPRKITTTVPPRETTITVPPRETTTTVPPRETTTTVPPRETATVPRKITVTVPPRETTAAIPPRETTAAVPPRKTTTTPRFPPPSTATSTTPRMSASTTTTYLSKPTSKPSENAEESIRKGFPNWAFYVGGVALLVIPLMFLFLRKGNKASPYTKLHFLSKASTLQNEAPGPGPISEQEAQH